jgi:hypothetical protein
MQWQREECKKDSGWIEKNSDWESEGVIGDNKSIRRYIHSSSVQQLLKQGSCVGV